MEYVVGVAVALGLIAFARLSGFERDRSFYSVALIVTASYYVLFAVMEAEARAVAVEIAVMALFVGAAVVGFRTARSIVAVAFLAHGLLDLVHHAFVPNPIGPEWWPMFCLSLDVALAAYLVSRRASTNAVAQRS